MPFSKSACLTVATLLLTACAQSGPPSAPAAQTPADPLTNIETIVVIYAENRSFDHLFGHFPGADGLDSATPEQKTQLDHDGRPLAVLPGVYRNNKLQEDYPRNLPNGPFAADQPPVNRQIADVTVSPLHSFYPSKEQINGGKNNKFVANSNSGGWVMATYDGSKLKMWKWAREYTLADHFFAGAFGGSYMNHQWLVCACVHKQPEAPQSVRAQFDETGKLKRAAESPRSVMEGPPRYLNGRVGEDSYVTDTADPYWQPSRFGAPPGADRDSTDPAKFPLAPQTEKTIGDTLSAKNISWAWYGSGWNQAIADGRREADQPRQFNFVDDPSRPSFQPPHQPFSYYARFAAGTKERALHLQDGDDFLQAIETGTLPQVSFYKPAGHNNQHSASSTVLLGDIEIDALVTKLRASKQWPKMAIIVTYDENGGYWDHMPPPSGPGWGDHWGPGTRVPAIIISPFAKRGYVDKTVYDTTSIGKFLARRYGLEPLAGWREKMGDLSGAFVFN